MAVWLQRCCILLGARRCLVHPRWRPKSQCGETYASGVNRSPSENCFRPLSTSQPTCRLGVFAWLYFIAEFRQSYSASIDLASHFNTLKKRICEEPHGLGGALALLKRDAFAAIGCDRTAWAAHPLAAANGLASRCSRVRSAGCVASRIARWLRRQEGERAKKPQTWASGAVGGPMGVPSA